MAAPLIRILLGVLAACVGVGALLVSVASAPVGIPSSPGAVEDLTLDAPRDPIREWVDARLNSMTVEDKVRSLFIHHVAGQDPGAMNTMVSSRSLGGSGAGGLILMRDNVPGSADHLVALTSAAVAEPDLPPIVAIDEEGGEVQRLPFDPYPGANTLRDAAPTETTAAFDGRGDLLASVGVTVNFGIVADVTSNSSSFIYSRTLGDDPTSAAERVVAAVSAESAHVASTLKHFPGHGRTAADSHLGVPTTDVSEQEWFASDAIPFQAGIDAGADMVMFGHLAFSAVDARPASLSPEWHRILREEMGFDGIIVTDDLRMLQDSGDPAYADPYVNVVAALNAGNDALLYVLPADPALVGIDREALISTLVSAVESGQVSPSRLDDAASRLLMFRRSLAPGAETWRPPCDAGCLLGGWFGEPVSGYLMPTSFVG